MSVSQKERALTEIKSELQLISAIQKGHMGAQELIEILQQEMQNLPRELSQKAEQGLIKPLWDYVQNITEILLRYRILILGNFERFILKIRKYLDLTLLTATEEQQKKYASLYKDLTGISARIKENGKIVDGFINEMQNDLFKGSTFLPRTEVKQNFLRDLSKFIGYSQRIAKQIIPYDLANIRYLINKAGEIIGIP